MVLRVLIFILFVTEGQRSFIWWFTPKMPSIVEVRPGCSLENWIQISHMGHISSLRYLGLVESCLHFPSSFLKRKQVMTQAIGSRIAPPPRPPIGNNCILGTWFVLIQPQLSGHNRSVNIYLWPVSCSVLCY